MYPHYELPSERVIAYTAAMIDGEGSICIQGARYQVTITQGVVNDGEDLCRWFAEVWGIGYVDCSTSGRKNPQWRWAVAQTHQVNHLLTACIPDMRVKKEKAMGALKWIHERIAEGRRCHWTPGEDRWVVDHWDQSDAELGAALGRSRQAVMNRRRVLRPEAPDRRGLANKRRVQPRPTSR